MLQVAASAALEVGTGRATASRARLQDLQDLGPRESGAALVGLHPQAIPGRRSGDEDGQAMVAAEAISSRHQLFDPQLEGPARRLGHPPSRSGGTRWMRSASSGSSFSIRSLTSTPRWRRLRW